jgi:hypothetical protein
MWSEQWGPPGLDTPKRVPGGRRLGFLAVGGLVVVIGVPWCQQNFGYIDLQSGYRGCGAAPSEVRAAFTEYTRRPEDAVHLQQWIARHPGRINKQYGAFCNTPLHVATQSGRDDLAEPLIAAGADVEARNNLEDRPLHVSATYGRPTVAKLLLARGADVSAYNWEGKTPLHSAACGLGGQSKLEGRIEVAKLLLAAGANVNARHRRDGFTPLRCATSYESRNTAMADLLFAHGADPRGAEEPPAPGTYVGRDE